MEPARIAQSEQEAAVNSDVAGNRLGVFEEFALGRSVDDVLAWCEPTPLRSSDLMRRGRLAGRLVLLE